MCGIFGAYLDIKTKAELKKAQRILNFVITRSQERGRDGYGYVTISEERRYAGSVIRTYPTLNLGDNAVLGNFRAEPTTESFRGEPIEKVLQPYTFRNWSVVHNGTIANDAKVRNYKFDCLVDSAAIVEVLDGCSAASFDGKMSRLKGSMAVLAFNKKEHRFFAYTNYKPIWACDLGFGQIFASSEEYFPESCSPKEIPPYSSAEYSLDNLNGHVYSLIESKPLFKRKYLVVASGGLDSTVAAAKVSLNAEKVTLLHFKYGCNPQEKEITAIEAIAKELKADVVYMDLPIYAKSSSPLLSGENQFAGPIEGAEFAHEWVPARNLVMLAIASAYAEEHGYDYIVLGNNMEEAGAYPDNEPEFIRKFNKMLPYALKPYQKVQVLSPVGNLVKHEIVALGISIAAPMHLTWSCYRNGGKHCGQCGPCYMRKRAFQINHEIDPIEYEVT